MALCAAGCTVYITGRTLGDDGQGIQALGSLTRTAREASKCGGQCIPLKCDHSDDAQVQAVFEHIENDSGRLDILVNNAFAGADSVEVGPKFFEKPIRAWDDVHNVGLRSQP